VPSPRLIVAALVATTLLGACGSRAAPACDADQTQGRAARVTLRILALSLGSHEIPNDLEHLIRADGGADTLEIDGKAAWWSNRDGRITASLRNVRAVDRNPRVGSWTCAAEVQVIPLRGAADAVIVPIDYESARGSNGDQVVHVTVRGDQVRRL